MHWEFLSNPVKLPSMTKKDHPNFEKSLADLQKVVDVMESGDLPLEKALEQFEVGVKLIRECQKSLQAAEQKVQILLKDKLVDFDNDDA